VSEFGKLSEFPSTDNTAEGARPRAHRGGGGAFFNSGGIELREKLDSRMLGRGAVLGLDTQPA